MTANDSNTVAQRELASPRREHEKPKSRFTPGDLLPCPRCGLTLHAAVIEHEQALVFALDRGRRPQRTAARSLPR